MYDTNNPHVPAGDEQNRILVLVVYGLYLAALVSVGIAGIAGVMLAYIKRGDTGPGSLWRTHFENQIQAFWIWFGLMVLGGLTWWMGLGFLVMGAAFIYFLYRTLKGFLRALGSKPYQ